jgi:hypothetical protein
MPCENYKNALIEAAASGTEPQAALRMHLAACAACRAAFEQEQSFFNSIDAGLHVSANPEVPTSLLPRVRARLDDASAPRRIWAANWLVLASAAAIIVCLFIARVVWRPNIVRKPAETAGKTSGPPMVTLSPHNPTPVVAPPLGKESDLPRQFVIVRNATAREALVIGKTMPEVLVPSDQDILLTEYAAQWRLHKRGPLLLAQNSDVTILSPLQVAPIQIAELDVRLLADEKSQ